MIEIATRSNIVEDTNTSCDVLINNDFKHWKMDLDVSFHICDDMMLFYKKKLALIGLEQVLIKRCPDPFV